eukprot:CAMPEP_0113899440 /NCGR_PEP_ID=MMETSP0780_2-20120614/20032_1 /TAXON_ID=652834 /ORGANISM="Palpitomonas bilix" /LENGTH=675 /DNA_ID=CAMNT_0000891607 /DNA_START=222 /DNA_END=2249 /DNA_ORIENTATION=- /assembly_acc=CAM_ASM_000599
MCDIQAIDVFEHGPIVEERDEYKLDTGGLQRGFNFNPDRMVIQRNRMHYNHGFAAVRAMKSCPDVTDIFYFEMKIAKLGASHPYCTCSIGISSGPIFTLHKPVGWCKGTFGYHGDDGKIFEQTGRGVQYGPIMKEGDVVGCGLNFIQKTIFFTHNGRMLGNAFHVIPDHPIYPSFSVRDKGEAIAVNLGCFPFRFDIDSYTSTLERRGLPSVFGRIGQQADRIHDEEVRPKPSWPSKLSKRESSTFCVIGHDGLTVEHMGNAPDRGFCAVRTSTPCPTDVTVYYFEMSITAVSDAHEHCECSIGLSSSQFDTTHPVGWDRGTYGYHGDDGHKFGERGFGEPYANRMLKGDVIGCGVNFSTQEIFYTKNGEFIGPAFDVLPDSPFYPSFSVRLKGEKITINFGRSPFRFNIDEYASIFKPVESDSTSSSSASGTEESFVEEESENRGMNLSGLFAAYESNGRGNEQAGGRTKEKRGGKEEEGGGRTKEKRGGKEEEGGRRTKEKRGGKEEEGGRRKKEERRRKQEEEERSGKQKKGGGSKEKNRRGTHEKGGRRKKDKEEREKDRKMAEMSKTIDELKAKLESALVMPDLNTVSDEELKAIFERGEKFVHDIRHEIMQRVDRRESERKCKVCMDSDIDVILTPCNHLCVCHICSEALHTCPICREEITETKRVFHA